MSSVFPIGIATGKAFCNRVKEKTQLTNNINSGRHTVLLGPRRYGKTSLVTEVINQLQYSYCEMDFLLCGNGDAVQAKILDCVGKLIYQILPKTSQLKKKMLALFAKLRPEIAVSYHEVELGVRLHQPTEPTSNENLIAELLENLDKAAQIAKKRCVVFMDEFQQIGQLRDQHVIEAAIRHAVERAKNVSYIFSGSNRHLLQQMFQDKSRPFYRLCQTFPLRRIAAEEHKAFIQKHAKSKWKKKLPEEVIDKIIQLSESHSYYVNLICQYFWASNQEPTIKKLNAMWQDYITNERPLIVSEIAGISNNQKIALNYFAKHPSQHPLHNSALMATGLSAASMKQAIVKLVEKDILHVNESGELSVLDPAIKAFVISG